LSFKTTAQARLYSVERYQPGIKTWSRIRTVAASSQIGSSVRVGLPSNLGKLSSKNLRVMAVSGDAPTPSDLSFPLAARLRAGISTFPPRKQASQDSLPLMAMTDSTRLAGSSPVSQDEMVVEESDLWKIRGRKIYLFNQLRGLQVLDVAVATNPVVAGFWSLPAVGEDMYLLGATNQPAAGAEGGKARGEDDGPVVAARG